VPPHSGLHYLRVGWLVNAYSSHFIYMVFFFCFFFVLCRLEESDGSQSQGDKLTKHKGGLVLGMKGVGSHDARLRFCKRIGWDHGGGRYYTKYNS
jgi:hypothetical protein